MLTTNLPYTDSECKKEHGQSQTLKRRSSDEDEKEQKNKKAARMFDGQRGVWLSNLVARARHRSTVRTLNLRNMTRRVVALAVRTEGDNSIENQGSDGCKIHTIGVHNGKSQIILPIDDSLDFSSILNEIGKIAELDDGNSLLVCRGATDLRQVLHPWFVRQNYTPSSLFCEFVNLHKLNGSPMSESLDMQLREILDRVAAFNDEELVSATETITIGVPPGVCSSDDKIEEEVVVRARGLPWQASDHHVAQFFAGLNIVPGGIALCLSSEGRRNGEALVRFETSEMRSLAIKRHRHFLLSRYIEVYRAATDEFLQVAGGCSSEAMYFVSRGAAVIIRMRGLPYDCTEAQIKEFFHSGPDGCEIMDQGVMFVNRQDGRPMGDAFVLFADEESGSKALNKHKNTIGSRYIELFRSTTAEFHQVMKQSSQTSAPSTVRRDCVRLRGLPYEARVEHVVDFLGEHSRNIVFQGVHMVFNAQGHPSGEAFIQMNSEPSAASAAAGAHNKFMTIGKKQRYIEVFQCSPDDMHLVMAHPQPAAAAPPPPLVLPTPVAPRMQFANPTAMPLPFGAMYWPYPSPPVSPNMMLSTGGQVLVTGVGVGVTPQDIANQFSNQETIVESVQMLRWATAVSTGEALVRLRSLSDGTLLMDPNQLAQAPSIAQLPLYPLVHT